MWRILPSSCSCLSSPTWSATGYGRVDAVQLEQVDPLQAEAAQAHLAPAGAGTPGGRPASTRPGPAGQPGLGGDDDVVGVRVQRLAQQLLGHERPVGVGGVEEGDAELDGAAQHPQRLVAVRGLAPDALAGELHGAVAEAYDGQVAAEREGAGRGGKVLGHAVSWRNFLTIVSVLSQGVRAVRCSRVSRESGTVR